jgi:hypothetical protein
VTTGRGGNEKNVQEKEEERTYDGREEEEDFERFLEVQRGLFRGH